LWRIKDSLELFVGGWAVESGDGDFVEAQVDGELAAVVDEVVEEHAAVEDGSGSVGDYLFSPAQLPVGLQAFIGGGLEGVTGFGAGLFEIGEELVGALEDERRHFLVARLRSSVVRIMVAKLGRRETWAARRPMGMDLSWGFHCALSGMRSRRRRVFWISAS
jgi:hypothetical protein